MKANSPKIVVVGSTFVDMAIRCDHIPAAGQSVAGSDLSYTITGPGPNQAVEAALCGCHVHLVSKVGGGSFGQTVKNNLAEYNVNTDFLYTATVKNTGTIITLVNSEGENASCIFSGANCDLRADDVEAAEQVISEANVCLIHGQLPQEAIVTAIRLAKIHGVKVILNPARPIEIRNGESSDLPLEYFSADALILNLYEAAKITEHSAANISEARFIGSDLIARGVSTAVITMGKRGCMVVDRTGADHIPAFEIELVDQTGTGDAFAGAFAACSAVEEDIRKAVKFASAAGALVCTKFGSIEALPTRGEIIELLQKEDVQ